MSTTLDDVTEQALNLTAEERAELLERLADTVSPAPHMLHSSWGPELAPRVAELDAGDAELIPAERVFAQTRQISNARRFVHSVRSGRSAYSSDQTDSAQGGAAAQFRPLRISQ